MKPEEDRTILNAIVRALSDRSVHLNGGTMACMTLLIEALVQSGALQRPVLAKLVDEALAAAGDTSPDYRYSLRSLNHWLDPGRRNPPTAPDWHALLDQLRRAPPL